MIEFLTYDLKVAVLLAVFYMFYRLLLARETFHRVNRIVLLLTAVASFVLPLCVITFHETVAMELPLDIITPPEVGGDRGGLNEPVAAQRTPLWQILLPILFIIGVLVTFAHTLWSLFRIVSLISKSEKHPQDDGTIICVTGNADMAPFSWMLYIVMNRSDYEEHNETILAHERGHIRLHHSWDLLLVDTLTALQWFNPAIWMLRSDLRAIHEYEADGAVLSQGINARQYQYLLITKAASIGGYSLANGISHSTLKNRINMMLHKKSNPTRLLKLIALIPIVAVALAVNAETVTDYVYGEPETLQPVKKGKVNATIKTGMNSAITVVAADAEQDAEQADNNTNKVNDIVKDKEGDDSNLQKDDNDKAYDVVEEMPQYPGGVGKLMEYVSMNVRYPKEAESKSIQGRVVTTFVIEKDGSIADAEVVKSVDPALDAEALRVIKAMPKWTPGKQDGKPIRVKYTMPITFALQGGDVIPDGKVKGANVMNETVVVGIGDNAKAIHTNVPYVLVDDKPIDSDKLKDIDPKTIDHMEVLKSKAAIEKYGEKAKNGVIIITTKK